MCFLATFGDAGDMTSDAPAVLAQVFATILVALVVEADGALLVNVSWGRVVSAAGSGAPVARDVVGSGTLLAC